MQEKDITQSKVLVFCKVADSYPIRVRRKRASLGESIVFMVSIVLKTTRRGRQKFTYQSFTYLFYLSTLHLKGYWIVSDNNRFRF